MCPGCLHRCPAFSIQYGTMTRKHGQYVNPYVKLLQREKEENRS